MLHLILAALLFTEYLRHVETSPIRESSKAFKENWFTRALHYMESYPETLEELMSKDSAVLEGDMMLSSDRNAVDRTWPTTQIPYVISQELASRTDDILSAMKMVSENTCVSFHKRTSETDYLLFKTSKGCASYVGFIGGEQGVFVGPPCIVGNIVHEILHALGFHHEHTRTDREQHITILPHNIMAGMERNFKKQQGETFELPYDVKSIMHYGSGFFSANGLPTIVPNVDVEEMGQRVKMTEMDIKRVRHLYSCDSTKKQTEKESSDVKKEDDTARYILVHDVKTTNQSQDSANKPEKDHRHTTAAPSDSIKKLDAATGGRNKTNREKL
ncbi:astacin-like metalloendopeptidase isoform X2 [Thunnus maccoyii]|uniref:astacin-like metalloendopeptidase isoform X2 n=1 Tax=Thunnus maccoyii TaxID=8240 RepID=UPI001C4D4F95|nr:astacin-like metalloendopeptidase isoform X2 [Thunnus maccoyii]